MTVPDIWPIGSSTDAARARTPVARLLADGAAMARTNSSCTCFGPPPAPTGSCNQPCVVPDSRHRSPDGT
ncbi:hypothetical protein [Streptomyces thinghirensis]|uniref:hypothetical protein n=1 Tax=Streptomyces thinghirensis TaxID=551547 RepID=UPI0031E717B8